MNNVEFLTYIQENVERINRYESGGDGSDGKCDCIGLIIGAWRQSGGKWPWTHGSNYAARHRTNNLRPFNSAKELRVGDLVYKGRQPDESGYSLPEKYKNGTDQTDYYHVGIVTRTAPLEITHCTSVNGGIKKDSKLGAWKYTGSLNLLEEGGEKQMQNELYTATVVAESGSNVKMRMAPDKNALVVKRVPLGATVTVTENCDDEWAAIVYGDASGFMMRSFLKEDMPADGGIAEKIRKAQALLNEVQTFLDGTVG